MKGEITMKREYRQEGYRVATVLPLSSDTSRFLQDVDNKADFLRMVLNDLMEAYPYPYEYTELSEEERLERFFGVKKPRERVIQELTKKVGNMVNDKERLGTEVEYVRFYIRFMKIFLEKLPGNSFFVWFVYSNVAKIVKEKHAETEVEYAVISDLKEFSVEYKKNCNNTVWMARLAAKERFIDRTEALFIRLTYHWFCLCNLLPDMEKYPVAKVTSLILDFMNTSVHLESMDDMLLMSYFTQFVKNKLKKDMHTAA